MATNKHDKRHKDAPSPFRVANTLIRWFTYNVLFASIPIAIAVTFRALGNRLSWAGISASPEFLFFAIMLNATALGDLSEVSPVLHNEPLYRVLHSAIFFCAVVSAIFYGCLVHDGIFHDGPSLFQWRMLVVSFFLDGVSLVQTTAAEIFLARIRDV